MRRTGLTILLLVYAFIQVGTIALYYAEPVIHTICYDLFRFRSGNKEHEQDTGAYIIRMNLTAFRKARKDEQEICWNGTFYDIRNVSISGNYVIVHAEKDGKETSLMNTAEDLLRRINRNPSPGSYPDTRFCQWLFKLYVPTEKLPTLYTFTTGVHGNEYLCQPVPFQFSDLPGQPPDGMI
jgi:hypothetical protein